jgi:hypothetical protein
LKLKKVSIIKEAFIREFAIIFLHVTTGAVILKTVEIRIMIDIFTTAELIAFPERSYGSTILVSIFRAGKMGNAK